MDQNPVQTRLDENIPESAVETREAWRGGPKLSYLTGAYIIRRLNEVLGQGNWGYEIKSMSRVFEGTIQQAKGEAFTVSYVSQISFWAIVGNTPGARFDEVGYGDGTDMKSAGKAHELATKEAVTDGVKRAAKNLGISLGLGLYFKSGEYIEDENPKAEPVKRTEAKADTEPKPAVAKPQSSKILKDQIKSSFAVLQAKKVITKEDFIKNYLNGSKTDDLADAEAPNVLNRINQDFAKELGLN